MFEASTAVEQSRHFFELAATIMPVVLFGSVLARTFRPPDVDALHWYHGFFALAIAGVVGFVATMEVVAVAAAVDGGAERGLRSLISIALVTGTFGFGLAITLPWANRFRQKGKSYWVATIIVGIALFLPSFAWSSVKVLDLANNGSLGTAERTELTRAEKNARHAEVEWLQAEISARADHRISRLERREIAILQEERQVAKKELKALRQQ